MVFISDKHVFNHLKLVNHIRDEMVEWILDNMYLTNFTTFYHTFVWRDQQLQFTYCIHKITAINKITSQTPLTKLSYPIVL